MSDRIRFSEHARITEQVLNDAFSYMEEADQRLVSDLGICGIARGLAVRPQHPIADLTVVVTGPGLAYDAQGHRIYVPLSQTVSCARSSDNVQTAVVAPGHERWVSIGVRFERDLSAPVRDQYNRVVHTRQYESFRIDVRAGEEGPVGHAERPPLGRDLVHLCDVRLTHEHEQVQAGDLDPSRRKDLRLWQARHIETKAEWRSLARTDSLEAVLNALDAAVAETRESTGAALASHESRLEVLDAALEGLAKRRFPAGRRITERALVPVVMEVPALHPGAEWSMAIRVGGLESDTHRVLAVRPLSELLARQLSVTVTAQIQGSVRMLVRNLSAQIVDRSYTEYEVEVAVLEAATPQKVPQPGQ